MKFSLCLFSFLLCTASSYAQTPFVKVNTTHLNPNEVSIYISPQKQRHMVAGANINWVYTSADSGKTWLEKQVNSPLGVWGDPVMLIDDSAYVYYAHLSRTPGKEFPENIDRIVVQRSSDNGNTFNSGIGIGSNGKRAQDKEWLSFDGSLKSKYYGNLYLSWTEFDKYGSKNKEHRSRIRFAASSDRGLSFTEPVVVSDSSGDCIDGDNTTEGATTTTTPEGTIAIAWAAFGKIFFDRSTDGGKSFGKDMMVAGQFNGWDMDISHIYRTNGMPFLASDLCASSSHKGRIYLCWADNKLGDADVWLIHSDDAGINWSSPLRVNRDATQNGKDQFLPHITVDPSSGHVYIIYYDRRHSPSSTFMDTYLAVSKNGGETFEEFRLTQSTPAAGKKTFFGDYITVAAQNGVVRPAWTAVGDSGLEIRTSIFEQFVATSFNTPHISNPFVNQESKEVHIHVSVGRKSKAVVQLIINHIPQPPVEVNSEEELYIKKAEPGEYHIRLMTPQRQLMAEKKFTISL
jgi:hypothetical protein